MQKNAIITGASRGIGRAVALELAQQGIQVILIARNSQELTELQTQIEQAGGKADFYALDIAQASEVQPAIEQMLSKYSQVDYLINNAGVGSFQEFEAFEEAELDRILNVNIKGTFLLTKALVKHMKTRQQGHIVTIASDVSKRTFPNGSVYCASKYAQDALMSALRKEVRSAGIKVSTIYPGLVDTHFNGNKPGEDDNKNWLKPEDIAQSVSYVLNAPAHVVVDELMIHPLEQEY
ncbi:MAG TPA: NAD(P)-dependent oxidoreductase [Microscillaceae bacterium]|nr:NAD(P)-dependent oxidoreductase [Microscillaceae bacterium]